MQATTVFRRESVAHRERGDELGYLVRYDRTWARWTLRVVVAAAIAGVLFACFFHVNEYASGPAVIRVEGRRTLTAVLGTTVDSVLVQPGQRVAVNDVLVRFRDVEQAAQLKRATTEYELQLIRLLRDPNDGQARQALTTLKVQVDLAKTMLSECALRAPFEGVVSDIRIRAGQHLDAGDAVLGLAAKDSPVYLVAMVPADFLPMLQKDQAMRFSLDGFKFEYRDLTVEAVGEEAVGPTEIKRFLGQELFDAVHLPQGAQVLVKARIPARSFASEGLAYAYSDGLTAQTDIKVRSEPIIVTLLPVLKAVRR